MTKQLLALVILVFSLSAAQAQDWENFVGYPQTAEGASSITFVNAATTTQEGMIYALETELVIYWFGSEGLEMHCGAESLVLKPLEVREVPRWCDGPVIVVHQAGHKIITPGLVREAQTPAVQ